MHNISPQSTAGWKQSIDHLATTLEDISIKRCTNDYYNCLIECDENNISVNVFVVQF